MNFLKFNHKKKLSYIIINASYKGICVVKNSTTFAYSQIAGKYLRYFMTHSLNIIFDDFVIWVLGYRI